MSDVEGKFVCTGGFIISGMVLGSVYGGTSGAVAGGAPAVPGVVLGALGGALWAAVICTRPVVKRFFQRPVEKLKSDFQTIVTSSLAPELRTFVKDSAPDLASNQDAVVSFMLEYLQTHRNDVWKLGNNNSAISTSSLAADARHGLALLKTARLLA